MLQFHQNKPINAEPPGSLLSDSWITKKELFFVRNHHPVPDVSPENYSLKIKIPLLSTDGKSGRIERQYTLEDLKTKFKKHTASYRS